MICVSWGHVFRWERMVAAYFSPLFVFRISKSLSLPYISTRRLLMKPLLSSL